MKKLLLITGDLATGKTTFGRTLSKRYGVAMLFKDRIKELLGDTIGFSDREENLKLSRATMEVMIYSFSELASVGQDMILEANFRSAELKRLYEIAADRGYNVLTLALRGDTDILYGRFIKRMEKENRHPVHISGFDNFENFNSYIEAGRREKIFGKVIEISADDFSYQTDAALLKKIDSFMEQEKDKYAP